MFCFKIDFLSFFREMIFVKYIVTTTCHVRGYVPNNRTEVAYEITINGRDWGHCKRKNRVENQSVMKKDYGCDKKIQFKEESNPKQ